MKSLIIAAVAALGFTVGGAAEAEAGSCYRGGGYGFSPSYGYGGGYGFGGYTPVYRQPAYVPVRRHRNHYHPVAGPVYPNGFHGYRGSSFRSFNNFGRRGGISIGFGW